MFLFLTPPAELGGWLEAIEGPLRHKHVAFRVSGVGSVSLLHDHKCVTHMAVQKMDPDVAPYRCLPLTPLHWAPNHVYNIWEGKPAVVGLLGGGASLPVTLRSGSDCASEGTPQSALPHIPDINTST